MRITRKAKTAQEERGRKRHEWMRMTNEAIIVSGIEKGEKYIHIRRDKSTFHFRTRETQIFAFGSTLASSSSPSSI